MTTPEGELIGGPPVVSVVLAGPEDMSERFLALVTDAPGTELPIGVFDLNSPDLSHRLADLVESSLLR